MLKGKLKMENGKLKMENEKLKMENEKLKTGNEKEKMKIRIEFATFVAKGLNSKIYNKCASDKGGERI